MKNNFFGSRRNAKKQPRDLSRSEQVACLILLIGWILCMLGLAAGNL